jgi:hypothetical protein
VEKKSDSGQGTMDADKRRQLAEEFDDMCKPPPPLGERLMTELRAKRTDADDWIPAKGKKSKVARLMMVKTKDTSSGKAREVIVGRATDVPGRPDCYQIDGKGPIYRRNNDHAVTPATPAVTMKPMYSLTDRVTLQTQPKAWAAEQVKHTPLYKETGDAKVESSLWRPDNAWAGNPGHLVRQTMTPQAPRQDVPERPLRRSDDEYAKLLAKNFEHVEKMQKRLEDCERRLADQEQANKGAKANPENKKKKKRGARERGASARTPSGAPAQRGASGAAKSGAPGGDSSDGGDSFSSDSSGLQLKADSSSEEDKKEQSDNDESSPTSPEDPDAEENTPAQVFTSEQQFRQWTDHGMDTNNLNRPFSAETRVLTPTAQMFASFCSHLPFRNDLAPPISGARKYGFRDFDDARAMYLYQQAPVDLREEILDNWKRHLMRLIEDDGRAPAANLAHWNEIVYMSAERVVPYLHHVAYMHWRYRMDEADDTQHLLLRTVVDRNYMHDRLFDEFRKYGGSWDNYGGPGAGYPRPAATTEQGTPASSNMSEQATPRMSGEKTQERSAKMLAAHSHNHRKVQVPVRANPNEQDDVKAEESAGEHDNDQSSPSSEDADHADAHMDTGTGAEMGLASRPQCWSSSMGTPAACKGVPPEGFDMDNEEPLKEKSITLQIQTYRADPDRRGVERVAVFGEETQCVPGTNCLTITTACYRVQPEDLMCMGLSPRRSSEGVGYINVVVIDTQWFHSYDGSDLVEESSRYELLTKIQLVSSGGETEGMGWVTVAGLSRGELLSAYETASQEGKPLQVIMTWQPMVKQTTKTLAKLRAAIARDNSERWTEARGIKVRGTMVTSAVDYQPLRDDAVYCTGPVGSKHHWIEAPAQPSNSRSRAHKRSADGDQEEEVPVKDTTKKPARSDKGAVLVLTSNRQAKRVPQASKYLVLDTGATVSVETSAAHMPNYRRTPGREMVMLAANGLPMAVDEVGEVRGIGTVAIVRDASDAIISVPQLAKNGCRVTFDEMKAVIQSPHADVLIVAYMGGENDHYLLRRSDLLLLMAQSAVLRVGDLFPHAGGQRRQASMIAAVSTTAVTTQTSTEADAPGTPTRRGTVTPGQARPLNPEQVLRAMQVRDMHCALAHPSDYALSNALRNALIAGTRLTERDVANARDLLGPCVACTAGKTVKESFTYSETEPAAYIGERVYGDVFYLAGKNAYENDRARVPVHACRTMLLVVDAYSNMMHIVRMNDKHVSSIQKALNFVLSEYLKYGHKVKEYHCDCESVFLATSVWLGTKGVALQAIPPYQHCQRVERQVRTIKERMRCLEAQSPVELPFALKHETARTAVYLLNDMATDKCRTQTPRMMFEGVKADFNQRSTIPYGTVGLVYFPEDPDTRSRIAVQLGPAPYSRNSNNVYLMDTQRLTMRQKLTPLTVIPPGFQWKRKPGMQNYAAPRRMSHGVIVEQRTDSTPVDEAEENRAAAEDLLRNTDTSSSTTLRTASELPTQTQFDNATPREGDISEVDFRSAVDRGDVGVDMEIVDDGDYVHEEEKSVYDVPQSPRLKQGRGVAIERFIAAQTQPAKQPKLNKAQKVAQRNERVIMRATEKENARQNRRQVDRERLDDATRRWMSTSTTDTPNSSKRARVTGPGEARRSDGGLVEPQREVTTSRLQRHVIDNSEGQNSATSARIAEPVRGDNGHLPVDATATKEHAPVGAELHIAEGTPGGENGDGVRAASHEHTATKNRSDYDSSAVSTPATDVTHRGAGKGTLQSKPFRKSERLVRKRLGKAEKGTRADLYARTYRISVKQALMGARSQDAKEAIIGEIMNMLNYQVGHYVHYRGIPDNKRGNILPCFMFLKEKTNPDGTYDKTKARLVGNGANQKSHMYDLVSSSTVALSNVFILFNLASYYRCTLASFDIKGAFLHAAFGARDEVTYIRIPREVAELWVLQDPSAREYLDVNGTLLLELDKFIYGLKQSPYKFQQHLQNVLIKLGYVQLTQDPCLYVKHGHRGGFSVLSTHVDDILQVTTDLSLYTELKDGLVLVYGDITTTATADAYLGMSIERSDCKRYLKLTQKGLVDKISESYPRAPEDRKQYPTPADSALFDCSAHEGASTLSEVQRREFLSVLMTLMYLARLTRPDVLMAVTYLASRTHVADTRDVECMRRIIRYLESSREKGVVINCDCLQLRVNCDASYGTHSPAMNCYGHTGFIIGFGERLSYIHARSGKQKVASTSSTDAEIIAMVEAVKMAVWLREILREMRITELTSIIANEDNMSAIHLTDVNSMNKRSKHLLTKLTYLHWVVQTGALDVKHVGTEQQVADVLSKPLQGSQHAKHVNALMGSDWGVSFVKK